MSEEKEMTELSALIEWLKAHGHNDSEIVDCLETICKDR